MLRWLLLVFLVGVTPTPGVPWRLPVPPPSAVRPVAAATPTVRAGAVPVPAPQATAVAVLDTTTGAFLYRQAARRPLPLASITKLMTALAVIDTSPDWQAVVNIQAADQRLGGRQWLQPGEKVAVEDLLELMLVASANEAAVALARSTGLSPSAFVAAMNRHAQASGLSSLRFADPAGLEAANVGNAEDVARLITLALQHERIRQALIRTSYRFTIRGTGEQREAPATNQELLLPGGAGVAVAVVGGKTGYLEEVGYNFAGVVEQSGRLVSVAVLGAATEDGRWQSVRAVVRWIYASYEWPHRGG